MERPMMNPMFLADMEGPPPPKRSWFKRILGLPGVFGRVLLWDVLFWRRDRLQIEDGTILSRLIHLLCYRLLYVPAALVLVVATWVYMGTHPPRAQSAINPTSLGTYFEPMTFPSSDGALLEAWLVPVLDAKTVLKQKEEVLKQKHAAVVLVHDQEGSRLQMLPLVKPLHDSGYIVLVLGLRGCSTGSNAGSTFGLREAKDVEAGVQMLCTRPEVDPARIAVIGVGTGANAAALASHTRPVSALVLDHPVVNIEQLVNEKLAPKEDWLAWLQPICKWGFELAYRVDFEELDLTRRRTIAAPPPTLQYSSRETAASFRPAGVEQICDFLKHFMPPGDRARSNASMVDVR